MMMMTAAELTAVLFISASAAVTTTSWYLALYLFSFYAARPDSLFFLVYHTRDLSARRSPPYIGS